jgi:ABC-2 type transport system ATP-binding protein
LEFSDVRALEEAARALSEAIRDEDALALQIPSEGDAASLRAVLDRLESDAIGVDRLTVRTPDLDDVFHALTGDSDSGKDPSP